VTAEQVYSAEFRGGYRVTMTVSMKGVECRWTPEPPRNLPEREKMAAIAAYCQWRNECLTAFASANGLAIHVEQTAFGDVIALYVKEPT
jgi:hypothetical protein